MPTEKVINGSPRVPIVDGNRYTSFEFRRWLNILIGRLPRIETYTATLDPVSIAAASTAEQTFTVNGVSVGEIIFCTKPSHTSGVGIVNVRVSAADTVAITFMNVTGGAVDPASEDYLFVTVRV